MNDFSLLIGLGSSLGLLRVMRHAPSSQEALERVNAGLIVLLGALAGARLGYVLARAGYYTLHREEVLQFWQGGLSLPGALGGALLVLVLVVVTGRTSLPVLADGLAPILAPLAVAAWLACWRAGCACGWVAPGAWWAVPSIDESGLLVARFPLQPLAALLLLPAFWALETNRALKGLSGGYGCLSGLAVGLDLALFSSISIDPAPQFAGLRLETWSGLILCVLSSLGFIIVYRRNRLAILTNSQNHSVVSEES